MPKYTVYSVNVVIAMILGHGLGLGFGGTERKDAELFQQIHNGWHPNLRAVIH